MLWGVERQMGFVKAHGEEEGLIAQFVEGFDGVIGVLAVVIGVVWNIRGFKKPVPGLVSWSLQ